MANAHFYLVDEKSKQYLVSGLLWQTIDGRADGKDDFAKLASEFNMDSAVVKRGNTNQLGLFNKDIIKGKLHSLAVVIAQGIRDEKKVDTFLFAGILPNNTWVYVAVKDGVFLPTGDFSGSESDVRDKLLEDYSISDWPIIYAPEEWSNDLPGAETLSINSIVSFEKNKLPKSALAVLFVKNKEESKSNVIFILIVAILLGSGLYGYKMYQEKLEQEQMEADRLARLALSGMVVTEVISPWTLMPLAAHFTQLCVDGIASVPYQPGGWFQSDLSCSDSSISAAWVRGERRTVQGLKDIIPNASFSVGGNEAGLTIPLNVNSEQPENEMLQPVRVVTEAMASQMQEINVAINLAIEPPPILPPLADGTPAPLPSWSVISWNLKTHFSPNDIISRLDRDGLRVKKVSLRINNGLTEWNLIGVQYVK